MGPDRQPSHGPKASRRTPVRSQADDSPPAGTALSLGTHTLTATFTPTNTTNYTGGTVSTQISVVLPCLTCK